MQNLENYFKHFFELLNFIYLELIKYYSIFINIINKLFSEITSLTLSLPYISKIYNRFQIEFNDLIVIVNSFFNSLNEVFQFILLSILLTVLIIIIISVIKRIGKVKLPQKPIIKNEKHSSFSNQKFRDKLLETELKLLEIQHKFLNGKISIKKYKNDSQKLGKEVLEI